MVSEILYPGIDPTEVHVDTAAAVSEVDVVTAGVVLAGIFSRKLINAHLLQEVDKRSNQL